MSTDPSRPIEARLAAIIESSFDAIIAKNLDSIITDWNPAAERLFGYSPAEAIGMPITRLIPDGLKDEEADIIRRIRNNERLESYETTRVRKDGTLVQVSITVSPIRNAANEVIGASKIARDITATKENERRIRFLLREINHRVKNQYAVILSLIREISKTSHSTADFQEKVRQRIEALSASHDLLVKSDWAGSSLAELLAQQLAPFANEAKVKISGSLIAVCPNAVQNLGMAFHELGTNSAKYGVLSGLGGSIEVRWGTETTADGREQFNLQWDERFDEPLAETPGTTVGFGATVLHRVAPRSLSGSARTEKSATGLLWSLSAPLAYVTGEQEVA